MISDKDLKTIKSTVEEFLQKMTVPYLSVSAAKTVAEIKQKRFNIIELAKELGGFGPKEESKEPTEIGAVNIDIIVPEAPLLIGYGGQTLFDLQRVLKMLLVKKIQKQFYLDLDVNEYKKKRIEYLRQMANDIADEVVDSKNRRVLPPMSSYERRIIHAQMAKRRDVVSASEGIGEERRVVIKSK